MSFLTRLVNGSRFLVGKQTSTDPHAIAHEVYNCLDEKIRFESYHPERLIQPREWDVIIVEPGKAAYLPHSNYCNSCPCGVKGIEMIQNYGDAIGVGCISDRPTRQRLRQAFRLRHIQLRRMQ